MPSPRSASWSCSTADQLRAGYAAALVKRQAHRAAFDTVFDLFFPAVPGDSGADDEPAPHSHRMDAEVVAFRDELREALLDGDDAALTRLARTGVGRFGAVAGRRAGVQSWSRYAATTRISPRTLTASLLERMLGPQDRDGLAERIARTTIGARLDRFDGLLDTEVQRRLAAESDAATVARTAARPPLDRRDLLSANRQELQRHPSRDRAARAQARRAAGDRAAAWPARSARHAAHDARLAGVRGSADRDRPSAAAPAQGGSRRAVRRQLVRRVVRAVHAAAAARAARAVQPDPGVRLRRRTRRDHRACSIRPAMCSTRSSTSVRTRGSPAGTGAPTTDARSACSPSATSLPSAPVPRC